MGQGEGGRGGRENKTARDFQGKEEQLNLWDMNSSNALKMQPPANHASLLSRSEKLGRENRAFKAAA